MAFTEFCCRSGGSNLNSGTRTGSSTVPGTGADFTYTSGTWVNATNTFTRLDAGSFITDGISVGDFASIYPDAATVTPCVSRITTVGATTLVLSATARSGAAPIDGVADTSVKVGGAWKGPNAASGFPFNFMAAACTNVAGNAVRVNFMNDASYSITAAMTHTLVGPTFFQGFTSAYGDLGRATIDGGTAGASYVLLTVSGSGVDRTFCLDLIFQNNGATGSATGVNFGNSGRSLIKRCVVNSVRGIGLHVQNAVECEAYSCNQSNTANLGGFSAQTTGQFLDRCISHDNSGSNNNGFYNGGAGECVLIYCIADTNGLHGFYDNNNTITTKIINCDSYNNGGDGWRTITASGTVFFENSNFIKNGGYGINVSTGTRIGLAINCGFGSGSQANTSGTINVAAGQIEEIGTITYASGVTPWVDPANGDFRINLGNAKGQGRGTFTETAASYSGTIGYPDIGAGQSRVIYPQPLISGGFNP